MAGPAKKTASPTRSRAQTTESPPAAAVPLITERQMRMLHVLMHDQGITAAEDVHDWLSLALGRDVGSRKDLSEQEASDLIDMLVSDRITGTPEQWQRLTRPFPEDEVEVKPQPIYKNSEKGNCRECGGYHALPAVHLSYIGHAGVTMRLNEVDPNWSWEPMAYTPDGLPMIVNGCLWIRLTILGVTRIGVGDAQGQTQSGNALKEMVGDAIRNAAMRFGVATYLWSKSEKAQATATRQGADPDEPETVPQSAPPPAPEFDYPTTADVLARIDKYADQQGITREQITAKWRERQGGLTVGELDGLPASSLVPLADSIAQYIESQGGHA